MLHAANTKEWHVLNVKEFNNEMAYNIFSWLKGIIEMKTFPKII